MADFDGGRQKDKTVLQGASIGHLYIRLFHLKMRFMTDLILSSGIVAAVTWVQVRVRIADDNIYSKKKKREMFFSVATSSEAVNCPDQNVLSPARVTDSLSSYQIRPLHLPS